MAQVFHSSQALSEFLSNNLDKSYKIKSKFSHKEGKTSFHYYQVTEVDENKTKVYAVVCQSGKIYEVALKNDSIFENYDTCLNQVFHYGVNYHFHAVFVEAESASDADKKGSVLLEKHISSARNYPGITSEILLHEVKSLYNSSWGYGPKINDIKSLTDIKVCDFFLTDKTISMKFVADIS